MWQDGPQQGSSPPSDPNNGNGNGNGGSHSYYTYGAGDASAAPPYDDAPPPPPDAPPAYPVSQQQQQQYSRGAPPRVNPDAYEYDDDGDDDGIQRGDSALELSSYPRARRGNHASSARSAASGRSRVKPEEPASPTFAMAAAAALKAAAAVSGDAVPAGAVDESDSDCDAHHDHFDQNPRGRKCLPACSPVAASSSGGLGAGAAAVAAAAAAANHAVGPDGEVVVLPCVPAPADPLAAGPSIDWSSRDFDHYSNPDVVSCPTAPHFTLPQRVHLALRRCFRLLPFQIADPSGPAAAEGGDMGDDECDNGMYHLSLYLRWAFAPHIALGLEAAIRNLPFYSPCAPFPDWLTLHDVYMLLHARLSTERRSGPIPAAPSASAVALAGPGGGASFGSGVPSGAAGFDGGVSGSNAGNGGANGGGGSLGGVAAAPLAPAPPGAEYVTACDPPRPAGFDPVLYYCLRVFFSDVDADPVLGCDVGEFAQQSFVDLVAALRSADVAEGVTALLQGESAAYEEAQGRPLYVSLPLLCAIIQRAEAGARAADSAAAYYTARSALVRAARAADIASVGDERRMAQMSSCGRCCARFSRWWGECFVRRRHVIPLWKRTLDGVEARLGPSIASFFFYTRSMFWLNMILIVLAAFIFIPGMITFDWSVPTVTVPHPGGGGGTVTANQSLWGLLTGTGMEYSFMFYGDGYKSVYHPTGYRMYLAWVLVLVAAIIATAIESLSRFHFIADDAAAAGDSATGYRYARLAFAGSSFAVKSRAEADLQALRLRTKLFMQLSDEAEVAAGASEQSARGLYHTRVRRAIGYFISLAFMVGSAILIIYLVVDEKTIRDGTRSALDRASEFVVPVAVSILKLLVPFVVRAVVAFEKYSRAVTAFKHTFLRIFVMRMFFVLLILFQTQSMSQADTNTCLQTATGVMYYRMMITDLVIDIIASLIIPGLLLGFKLLLLPTPTPKPLRHGATERDRLRYDYEVMVCAKNPSDLRKPTFRLPENIVDIMYRQALVLAALPFCPVMPIAGALFMAASVGIKAAQAKYLTRLPVRSQGAHTLTTRIRTFTLVTLAIVLVPISYFLRTPVNCGIYMYPIRGRSTPFDALLRWISRLPGVLRVGLTTVFNAAFLWVSLLVCLILAVYYTKKLSGFDKEVNLLRSWLRLERRQTAAFLREHRVAASPDDVLRARRFAVFASAFPPALGMRLMVHAADAGIASEEEIFSLPQAYLRAFCEKAFAQGDYVDEQTVEHAVGVINDLRPRI